MRTIALSNPQNGVPTHELVKWLRRFSERHQWKVKCFERRLRNMSFPVQKGRRSRAKDIECEQKNAGGKPAKRTLLLRVGINPFFFLRFLDWGAHVVSDFRIGKTFRQEKGNVRDVGASRHWP